MHADAVRPGVVDASVATATGRLGHHVRVHSTSLDLAVAYCIRVRSYTGDWILAV